LKSLVTHAVRVLGYDLVPRSAAPGLRSDFPEPDFTERDIRDYGRVKPFTLTSSERVLALIQAVRHVVRSGLEGAIVECGAWKGGSMMAAAYALLEVGTTDRDLHLFDTFDGMSEPTEVDIDFEGNGPARYMKKTREMAADLGLVRANLMRTGYPESRLHFIKGKVEDTLPANAPEKIALLRLDTDWYESTRHELLHLYPRVVRGGIVIIDDYGHFQGCRKAVDEFLNTLDARVFLSRIDYSGRLIVKP
jgi:hypothetical protein